MADKSSIEWTDATWNPWHGCIKVSPGCKNCYMYRDKRKYGQDPSEIVRSKSTFNAPLKWKEPKIVFTCSWSDFFIKEADGWRDDAWDIIKRTPQHTYQILTKRPELIEERLPSDFSRFTYPHVWLGISAENQGYFDKRWRYLRNINPAVKFVSYEPALGPLSILQYTEEGLECSQCEWTGYESIAVERYSDIEGTEYFCPKCDAICAHTPLDELVDWVIAGGESGSNARPAHPEWFRSLRDECKREGIPYFFKQWGEWSPTSGSLPILPLMDKGRHGVFDEQQQWRVNEGPSSRYDNLLGVKMFRVGKKAAGRLLDGVEYNELPR